MSEQGELESDVLIGCPDPGEAERWQRPGVEVVGTERLDDYLAAFDRVDVVIINYRRDRYFWRASGVAADALSRRVPVVCPDFPVMRRQLTGPAPVGVPFASKSDLVPAIARALDLRAGLDAALAAHAAERGVAAIARRIDDFVRLGQDPGP